MIKRDVTSEEYNSYYEVYLNMVSDNIMLSEGFLDGKKAVVNFFTSIPEEKHNYAYAESKWTVKEVLQHLIDTERVFIYRCFRIARRDASPLAGFDQDDFIKTCNSNSKSITLLLEEFISVRDSFIVLLKTLKESDLKFIGEASGFPASARAIAFINLGHCLWHIDVIKEHYL
ncbi:DinB family protein [Hyunsoonleella pacifica]|uniref:DinB family protein n=1 Tax=Hyunsoonleella pacifica TaxID=1080224 RepID=A0A4V2JAV2_9FLAO|nr:DinB family protein [Hyunsoonleella pacifica]TBN15325.1 DinB family protein [Hyunsoonleella pacifica]GGD23121.1 DNA damage-inducible protein DinB [Hyunsoonleella pacifica]